MSLNQNMQLQQPSSKQNERLTGCDYIDELLEKNNLDYSASRSSRNNIPANGRVIILVDGARNALEKLAVLRLIREIRADVKLVSNEAFLHVRPLQDLVFSHGLQGDDVDNNRVAHILCHLEDEVAVVIFLSPVKNPVKRQQIRAIRESESQYISLAEESGSSLLPVFVKPNTFKPDFGLLQYSVSQKLKGERLYNIDIKVGESIPIEQVSSLLVSKLEKHKQIKRHLHKVAKHKKPLFETEKTIIHPQDKYLLKKELIESECLGATKDGHKIYLFDYADDSYVMKEVGRLREYTFRFVGEGTGRRVDIDRYDRHYRHIVLWNDAAYEIVGSYRLYQSPGNMVLGDLDLFYSAELFQYNERALPYLNNGLELGRSFIYPKYWGKRSLEYLWYGIGTYLRRYSNVRYLFGPVSISNSYPRLAKDWIVFYYQHYFGTALDLLKPNHAFEIDPKVLTKLREDFICTDRVKDFAKLKEMLTCINTKPPVLYKQYSELCDVGGVQFLGFSIDPEFNDCVDGLVLVDLDNLTAKKRAKYIG